MTNIFFIYSFVLRLMINNYYYCCCCCCYIQTSALTSSEPACASLFSLLADFVVNFSNLFWMSYIYAFKCSSLPR